MLGWLNLLNNPNSLFLYLFSSKIFFMATVSPVSSNVALNTMPKQPLPTTLSILYDYFIFSSLLNI